MKDNDDLRRMADEPPPRSPRGSRLTLCLIMATFVSALIISCDYFIWISAHNQSNRHLLFHVSYKFIYDATMYPDTMLSHDFFFTTIEPGETVSDAITNWGRNNTMRALYEALPSDTICYFFIDADTIAHYGRINVCDDYRILVRYDLSVDDVEVLQETIPYPPSPAMRYMKMYPPYEEVLRREEEYNNRIDN